jgi:hypothetical protein
MQDEDMLDIPAFLRRDPSATPAPTVAQLRRRRTTIPYPKNGGYTCRGKGKAARERHLAALRRRAERMRQRRKR